MSEPYEWTEADHRWGYPFAVDGCSTIKNAAEFADVKPGTIWDWNRAGKIRIGSGGRVCVRSLKTYLHGLEIDRSQPAEVS